MQCPKCGQAFTLNGTQLRCTGGHCYDLSSKGYVNLAPQHDQSREKYDAALFDSRSRIFDGGFYAPLWAAIENLLKTEYGDAPFTLADIGCGEGYYTRMATAAFPGCSAFGIDLSRDGIQRAARYRNACWLVGDLKQLPLGEASVDVLLDVLTPSDYASFRRVLRPEGFLLKAIPGNDYLREIRALVRDNLRNRDYDNSRVLEHLSRHGSILDKITIRHTFPLTAEQSADFLRMTPMTFSLPEASLEGLALSEITIHMELLKVRLSE
jgi:23S rRNA (guanine745-N1)-methyltransferase